MNITVKKTDLEGLFILEPEYFQDHRGFFFESYHKKRLEDHGIDLEFVQDNHSRSSRAVLRGLHFQDNTAPQHRIVRCTVGEVWDVAVDLRSDSPNFGKWFGVSLSAENRKQLLLAPHFAHGFVVLSDVAEIQYKCSGHHNPAAEKTLAWNDQDVNVRWPVTDPILSDRDRTNGMSLKEYRRKPFF